MIAVQGPRSAEAAARVFPDIDTAGLGYYRFVRCDEPFGTAFVARTGYTGEDGFEIIVESAYAPELWDAFSEDAVPAGLGARDTLRLEAGMPLYGHELTAGINPLEAGLAFAVDMDHDFTGRSRLEVIQDRGIGRRRTGFVLDAKRIPRQGCDVFAQGTKAGTVTSGTFSPTLSKPVCMAYIDSSIPDDAEFSIDIRRKNIPAAHVELPFYTRDR
jgi:aminomethyltransferase